MKRLLLVITFIAAIVAGFVVAMGLSMDGSAVQQTSMFALAVAMVAIPYCGARSVQLLQDGQASKERYERIVAILEGIPAHNQDS